MKEIAIQIISARQRRILGQQVADSLNGGFQGCQQQWRAFGRVSNVDVRTLMSRRAAENRTEPSVDLPIRGEIRSHRYDRSWLPYEDTFRVQREDAERERGLLV